MKWTNKHNLPSRVIKQLGVIHRPQKDRISITHLIGSPRERTLLMDKWDDVVLDYSDFLSTICGISVHDRQNRLDKNSDDVASEVKYEDKVGSITVVGRSDNYDIKEKVIGETKVKAVGCLKYKEFIQDVEFQLNCYAWQRIKRGFEVNGLRLDVYYRDWIEWKADQANNVRYAVMKEGRKTALKVFDTCILADNYIFTLKNKDECYTEERKPGEPYPHILVEFDIPVKLWTFNQQQEFIEDQCELFSLAPMYCDDNYKWKNCLRCKKYCKARNVCEDSPMFGL